MAPVLRLYEDTLSNTAEAVGLPPVPRMIFVVHGAATIGGSAVNDGETWHGEADVMLAPGVSGVTGWRFELVPEGAGDAPLLGAGIRSQLKLAARLDTLRAGELLMRGDSVAFPPGGCAYLHRHQGPGIRCLIEGGIRIDTDGRSTSYGPGAAWYEVRPYPGVRPGGGRPAVPLHPRDDPATHAPGKELDPVRQRGGQGEAQVPAVPRLR